MISSLISWTPSSYSKRDPFWQEGICILWRNFFPFWVDPYGEGRQKYFWQICLPCMSIISFLKNKVQVNWASLLWFLLRSENRMGCTKTAVLMENFSSIFTSLKSLQVLKEWLKTEIRWTKWLTGAFCLTLCLTCKADKDSI